MTATEFADLKRGDTLAHHDAPDVPALVVVATGPNGITVGPDPVRYNEWEVLTLDAVNARGLVRWVSTGSR